MASCFAQQRRVCCGAARRGKTHRCHNSQRPHTQQGGKKIRYFLSLLSISQYSVSLPCFMQISKAARNVATTFAPRASTASKNPAYPGRPGPQLCLLMCDKQCWPAFSIATNINPMRLSSHPTASSPPSCALMCQRDVQLLTMACLLTCAVHGTFETRPPT